MRILSPEKWTLRNQGGQSPGRTHGCADPTSTRGEGQGSRWKHVLGVGGTRSNPDA